MIMTDTLKGVIPQWKTFALELRLDSAVVDEINGVPSNLAVECLGELLQQWIKFKGHGANIASILIACEKVDKELAKELRTDEEICEAFPTGMSACRTFLTHH